MSSPPPLNVQFSSNEPTLNKTGFMFHNLHPPSVTPWLNSLPSSKKPLLDLGCAFGIHTLHALQNGRDVIALDCHQPHLDILQQRAKLGSGKRRGQLKGVICATLPTKDVLSWGSVAGVLLSEILHFLKPDVVQSLFDDVYYWLEPGGTFISTSSSSTELEGAVKKFGFKLKDGRKLEQVLGVLKGGDAKKMLKMAPGYVEFGEEHPLRASTPGFMYLLSVEEVEMLARRSGFEIEKVSYFDSGKYWEEGKARSEGSEVMLIAKKGGGREREGRA